jgi:hypothetical protein
MEAICSSETWVDTQRTTRRYIPEIGTLHNHRYENLKSYILKSIAQFILRSLFCALLTLLLVFCKLMRKV